VVTRSTSRGECDYVDPRRRVKGEITMQLFTAARTWVTRTLLQHERGQTAVEYVLMILAVVLFLIFAAIALQPVLNSAVASISSWIAGNGPPP
jgi:Flp pilus assembly pilin Flp